MEQGHCSEVSRKGKHLTQPERVVIEQMRKAGYPAGAIAQALGRHRRTIEREIQRGLVQHRDSEWRMHAVYSSDRGQQVHDLNATARGPALKLGNDRELVAFIRKHIAEKRESPAVVASRMREAKLPTHVCAKTIYNYIDQNLIAGVSNETLWEKRQRRKRGRNTIRRVRKQHTRRQSIEQRPEEVASRESFGHWEGDLLVGPTGTKGALLTLVERQTRKLLIRKLKDKSQAAVLRALNGLERAYGREAFAQLFRSLTVDNGSEFLDVAGMQNSVLGPERRLALFYAHPFSSWERGSNENINRMIRRFVRKDQNLAALTRSQVATIEHWINRYPRSILNFKSSDQCFQMEFERLVA